MANRRVVITGRGVVSPLGIGIEKHQEGIFSNRSFLHKSEKLAAMNFPLTCAGEVSDAGLVSAMATIPPKQKKLMNRAGILAAIASALAAKEACLSTGHMDPTRIGVCLASWFTSYDLPSYLRYLAETESTRGTRVMDAGKANAWWLERMNPIDFSLKVLPNLSAGHLAILHQAQGGTRMIADGWRGGLLAVAQAAQMIQDGDLDVVLAGGAESPLEEGIFCDLCMLPVLARDGDSMDGICRPFDASRSGTVLGEGAGVVVLEERNHALQRNATLYGEVIGSGSAAAGADGNTEKALTHAMLEAMSKCELSPDGLSFIHANGDSTLENDRAEWRAISDVLGPQVTTVPVTATKSLHGHLLSGAGVVELISSLLMLDKGMVPPITNCDHPDPECPLDLVRGMAREKQGMRAALLNAVGLFGEAASLVVER